MIEVICIAAGFIFGIAAVVIYTVAVWEINERRDFKKKHTERGK